MVLRGSKNIWRASGTVTAAQGANQSCSTVPPTLQELSVILHADIDILRLHLYLPHLSRSIIS